MRYFSSLVRSKLSVPSDNIHGVEVLKRETIKELIEYIPIEELEKIFRVSVLDSSKPPDNTGHLEQWFEIMDKDLYKVITSIEIKP